MIDEQLQDSLIPATVLLNNFVTNENKSNYEFFYWSISINLISF